MAEKKSKKTKGSQVNADSGSTSVGSLNVGRDVGGSIAIGNNISIVNNYYPEIEKNTENHEPDYWALKHPYPMPPNFTGRVHERATLTQWLKDDSENHLFILRALGGFGKSALSWQWLTHDVKPEEFPKVVFWSFYEGDASFEHFIEETLKYLNIEVPQGQHPQVDALLKAMQGGKILLIMDGFERALRAYSSMNAAYQGDEAQAAVLGGGDAAESNSQLDCVNINAEIFLKNLCSLPNIKSKVLITTRLTPRAVKPRGEHVLGCREVELTSMQPADAVEFFHKQKIKGTHAEIEAVCATYGYHPLSLRLLAGRILKDFENPADIVVAQRLQIDGDIIQQKHHVLEVSYDSLPEQEQKLLSTIACFRSPIELKTLEAITESKENLDTDLHDLVERGLLHFDDKNKKFDLHPIVRRYTYERLTTPDRTTAHTRLIDYFEAVPKAEKAEKLEDFAPVIELYYHMVRAGMLDEARQLYRDSLANPIHYRFGMYQIEIELLRSLFPDSEGRLPRLKEKSAQAWTLNELAGSYAFSGQSRRAVPLVKMHNTLAEKASNKRSLSAGLLNMATQQLIVGALKDANSNLRRQIDLSREIEYKLAEGVGHQELSLLLSYCGVWQEAKRQADESLKLAKKEKHLQMQGATWLYRTLHSLLIARSDVKSKKVNLKTSIESASHAFELTDEDARQNYPVPRDFIRAYWLLGAAYRMNNELDKAEENLSKAISMCRQINLVADEANIILDLARLRYDQKNFEEAKSLADEALLITERCGYVLQGADVNLFLAQYALEQEKDQAKAKAYAEEALKLATCDGPPYYYKVAYEEAERLLARLNV